MCFTFLASFLYRVCQLTIYELIYFFLKEAQLSVCYWNIFIFHTVEQWYDWLYKNSIKLYGEMEELYLTQYDAIIIGAGSMGMAAGYYLAKQGKKTLLIDSYDPPHTNGAHHGETRIIRHAYGEGAEYVPLALKAQQLWGELEEVSGKQLFLQTGVINVGKADSLFMKNIIDSAKTYNLPVEVLQAREVMERWPGIKLPADYIGCFEKSSGVLKNEVCIEAYKEQAIKMGADLLTYTEVLELHMNNGKATVKTASNEYQADALIVCGGAWSGKLLGQLGLNLPLSPTRKTFAWFDADEAIYSSQNFPAFSFETDEGMYYGFPSIDQAGLKIGRHDGGERIDPDETMSPFGELAEDEGDVKQFLTNYMPLTEELKFGKTCTYTLTPDEDFIIDLHPDYTNVAIAAGFSGHGFKFSSVVGEILSDLATMGKTEHNISPFSIKRFK